MYIIDPNAENSQIDAKIDFCLQNFINWKIIVV